VKYFFPLIVPFTWFYLILCNTPGPFQLVSYPFHMQNIETVPIRKIFFPVCAVEMCIVLPLVNKCVHSVLSLGLIMAYPSSSLRHSVQQLRVLKKNTPCMSRIKSYCCIFLFWVSRAEFLFGVCYLQLKAWLNATNMAQIGRFRTCLYYQKAPEVPGCPSDDGVYLSELTFYRRWEGCRSPSDYLWALSPLPSFFLFLSFGVTVDAEAGMTVHSQRWGLMQV